MTDFPLGVFHKRALPGFYYLVSCGFRNENRSENWEAIGGRPQPMAGRRNSWLTLSTSSVTQPVSCGKQQFDHDAK